MTGLDGSSHEQNLDSTEVTTSTPSKTLHYIFRFFFHAQTAIVKFLSIFKTFFLQLFWFFFQGINRSFIDRSGTGTCRICTPHCYFVHAMKNAPLSLENQHRIRPWEWHDGIWSLEKSRQDRSLNNDEAQALKFRCELGVDDIRLSFMQHHENIVVDDKKQKELQELRERPYFQRLHIVEDIPKEIMWFASDVREHNCFPFRIPQQFWKHKFTRRSVPSMHGMKFQGARKPNYYGHWLRWLRTRTSQPPLVYLICFRTIIQKWCCSGQPPTRRLC